MRRISTAIIAGALALSMTLSVNTQPAAAAAFDSAYQFESAFLSMKPGDSGTFSVFFANTGTTAWIAGGSSQVNLAICAADKVTCNVTSAQAAWAVNWLSATAYATHTKTTVAPGDFSAFTYNIKVPAGTAAGTYRFNGDLVNGTTRIHPEGYYQDASVSGAAPGPGGALSVTPAYSVNEDNEVSNPIPGIGQHTYTFTTTLTGNLSFSVQPSSTISRVADGSYGFCDLNQDSKADAVGSAGAITAVNGVAIAQTNPLLNQPIPSNGTLTITIDDSTRNDRVRVVAWQDLNGNGQIDLSAAGDVNCDFATQALNNTTVDGAMIVSGRKFFFGPAAQFGAVQGNQGAGPSCGAILVSGFPGANGATYGSTSQTASNIGGTTANAVPMYRHDAANQIFGAGLKSTSGAIIGDPNFGTSARGSQSLRYAYKSTDTFQVLGTQVTAATWKSEIDTSTSGSADQVAIAYDPSPTGISTFNLCVRKGWDAPRDVTAAIGNFDNGTTAEDVRLTYTTPSSNITTTFNVQRATKDANNAPLTSAQCTSNGSPNPNGSDNGSVALSPILGVSNGNPADSTTNFAPSDGTRSVLPNGNFSTVGTTSTNGTAEQGTFTNFDLTNGPYCFRLLATDPNLGINSYSNYVFVNIVGGAAPATTLTSQSAVLTLSSGFQNTMDTGDKFEIQFNDAGCVACGVSVAPNAVIRVTDSDCGTWANTVVPNNGSQTPTCSGSNSNTVADIICGTNATCTTSTFNGQTNADLVITMTGNPTVVAAGSVAGAQYPVFISDSSGVTDLAGNAWNLVQSPDRVMGPNVGQ